MMLPVRVETRWFPAQDPTRLELRVRILPDEIHIAAQLATTVSERELTAAYLADTTPKRWGELVQLAGTSRAAWLVRVLANGATPVPQAETDTRRVNAWPLPKQWLVIAKAPGLRSVATGSPITTPLQAVPHPDDPHDASYLGNPLAWLTRFDAAEQAGMALRMTMLAADAHRLDELIVLGVPHGDPDGDGAALADLIARHAGGEGAECLAAGTPTNVAGMRQAPSGSVPIGPAPTGDAARLLMALGVDPAVTCDLVAQPVDRDAIARAMHVAMWPATWGYFLDALASRPAAEISSIRELYVDHVRPAGPHPSLRVRNQPYGILPATSLARWPATDPRGGLAALLTRIAAHWEPAVGKVPRLVDSTDVDKDLLAVLRRLPSTVAAWVRMMVDHETASVWIGNVAKIANVLQRIQQQEAGALGVSPTMPIFDRIYADQLRHLGIPFVAPAPVSRDAALPVDYLSAIAGATSAQLQAFAGAPTPHTLLYLLARYASIRARIAVLPVLEAQPMHPEVMARTVPVAATTIATTIWNRFDGRDHVILANPDFQQHAAALNALGRATVGELETAFAGVLDTASYRLDAWSTALASERLAALRTAKPRASHVGGWAWLERPRPAAAAAPGGYLLAPSLAQARTAAVLRAGYDAHRRDSTGSTLALDLSSERVRNARELLDSMREGVSIDRLLGAFVESWLLARDSHTDLVALRSSSVAAGAPVPDVADGWALYHRWTAASPGGLLEQARVAIDELLDATADLLLADSVHHALAGNAARSAASLDAMQRGEIATPDPRVDRTMTDGARKQRRILLRLDPHPGWPGAPRPRAIAFPLLEGLAARVLGAPDAASLVITDTTAGGATSETRTLADLDLCALDVVVLAGTGDDRLLCELAAALFSVPAGAVRSVEGSPELDALVLRAAALARLLRGARTPIAGDLGSVSVTPPTNGDAAIVSAVAAVATTPRFGAAALFGPAIGADPKALSAAATALCAAGADPVLAVVRSGFSAPATIGDTAVLAQDASALPDATSWLSDMARVRSPLEPLDLLVLLSPQLFPGDQRVTEDGVALTLFGTGSDVLVIDGWTETAPAETITAGIAFPFQAPRAQPPQAVLIAVPPPGSTWSVPLAEAIVDETIASARRRMVAPEDVRSQLVPTLLVVDDPSDLEPTLDLHAVTTNVQLESRQ
ncbi:MAG TPA: hypothetical protein VLT45_10205 [Kofleriaceae bacterium]|nr:hypothetical protein [Kofleriaceae bacterium]